MSLFLSIIIYGYNEGENAPSIVREALDFLDRSNLDGEVVFVDDGSRDDTQERLKAFDGERRLRRFKHEANKGIGAAIRTGVAGSSGEWVVPLPADGQISPQELEKMIGVSGDVQLVISRFPQRFKTADDMVRRVFSIGFHLLCQAVMGGGWGMDGVWMARGDLVRGMSFPSDTFVANIEIPVRLIRAGRKWKRVDLQVRRREKGGSKIFSAGRIMGVAREIFSAGVKIKLTK